MAFELQLEPLKPKDAIAYFRSKGLTSSFAWQDVWEAEHARAFTVAKMMSRELLETTRVALDRALEEGLTFEQFRAELAPRLQAAGWWGKQLMTDPLTGEEKLVQLGSDRRLRTIFNTNLRVAHRVGNWQRAWANRDVFPFMMYRHHTIRFPRLEHKAWDGTVLPITDPWWETHYGPNGWGCNCDTISLSQRQLDRRGLKVTENPIRFPPRVVVNPRTGEVTTIETGIDPGWNYNVGKAPLRALTARPAPPPSSPPSAPPPLVPPAPDAPSAPEAAPAPAPDIPSQIGQEVTQAIDAFLETVGAVDAPRIVTDRDSWPVVVGRDLFRDAAGIERVPRPDLVAELVDVALVLLQPATLDWFWDTAGRLIRRYTSRIDKRRVTVDFAPDTWTYDVQDD